MPEIHFKCLKKLFEETGMESSMIFPTCVVLFFQQMFVSLAVTFYLCVSINILRNMKNYLLLSILCLAGILMSCTQKHTRYRIGVSQCSDDEWRHKMNNEIVREALFYDGVEVEIRTAKDNNRNQIADIKYFIDKKVDLLIVAPNEAAAITPVVEKAYRQGIPVVVIDRKILSDKYTAFVGADNYEIGKDVGQYILNRLHGKGKVLEITGLEGSTPAMERHKGLTDVLKEEPGIEITASVDGAWLQSVAGEKMDSVFQNNKNIFGKEEKFDSYNKQILLLIRDVYYNPEKYNLNKNEIIGNEFHQDIKLRDFVYEISDLVGVDPDMALSIACAESGYFEASIATSRNNPYALNSSNGFIYFDNIYEGITEGIINLKENYIDLGLTTYESITSKYCPGSTSWSSLVRGVSNELKNGKVLYDERNLKK